MGSPARSEGGWLQSGGGGGGGDGTGGGAGSRSLLPRRRSGSFGVGVGGAGGRRPRSVSVSSSRSGGGGVGGGGASGGGARSGIEVRARFSLAWRKDVRLDYCLEFRVRKGDVGEEGRKVVGRNADDGTARALIARSVIAPRCQSFAAVMR